MIDFLITCCIKNAKVEEEVKDAEKMEAEVMNMEVEVTEVKDGEKEEVNYFYNLD